MKLKLVNVCDCAKNKFVSECLQINLNCALNASDNIIIDENVLFCVGPIDIVFPVCRNGANYYRKRESDTVRLYQKKTLTAMCVFSGYIISRSATEF